MKERLIECYHELLEFERKKLRAHGDIFTDESKLKKEEIENVSKKFDITLSDLMQERLLVSYPDGKFRTLHYDMIYRLVNIRAFEIGSRIPLEYKIFQHYEYLPNFNEKSVNEINVSKEIKGMLIKSGKKTLSNFQAEYINSITEGKHKVYVISSPTATGKSLIFTVAVIEAALKGERSILIYPRKALAADQLMVLLEYLVNINEHLKNERRSLITIGIDDGDALKNDEEYDKNYGKEFRGIECPICKRERISNKLIYSKENNIPIIRCERRHIFDFIIPTKKRIWEKPPLILITNGYTLNRRLMELQAQELFKKPVKYIVLDEAHVYREETGAHIHFVIKRLKRILKSNTNTEPLFIISSATLPKNTLIDFASKLLQINENEIFWESYEKLVSKGKKKYIIHLVLLPNPFRSAEVLAENILLFLLEWSYFTGKKSIFFVDSIHEIHRLRHFAEVIIKRRLKDGITRALEHLKSTYDTNEPFYWGHYSTKPVGEKSFNLIDEFSKILDYHHGGLDRTKRFQIEENFKKGLKRCLLATSTLELGIDIGDIAVIAHYRYPFSGESYIQRVGRAGRSEESYYTTLSILILTNSPAQLKYVYGEETPSLFELPRDYIIPLPLENDSIIETHQFFEVLDKLAHSNKSTFISSSDIKKYWKGRKCIDILLDIEQLLKNGINVQPDKKALLESYLVKLQHRKDLLELTSDETIPFPFQFKEKLDILKDLEERIITIRKEVEKLFEESFPARVKNFLIKLSDEISCINTDVEHVYKHFKAGDRESFEKVGRRIGERSNALKKFFLDEINIIDRSLNEFWAELMDKNAPEYQRDFLKRLIFELSEIKTEIGKIELPYRELLGFFLNIRLEIESFLSPNRYRGFNLIEALNILGIPKYHLSLLFDKPLPRIYVNYPGLSRTAQEYMERTIDKLLWICTPFRVTPISDYFFTIIYGLEKQKYKIIGQPDYTAFEGGDYFSFKFFNKKYTAWTPHFVNMINLNQTIIEAYSDKVGGSQNSKVVLSNLKEKGFDLENCRFCQFGFLITSENKNSCVRTAKDCSLYHKCNGQKWFVKPIPPQRTSYLGLVKVYPQIYTNAKNFETILMDIPINDYLTVKLGKGSLFDRALIGCYIISSGDFYYSPMFSLQHNTIGYRVSSNGIVLEFQKDKLKIMLKRMLEMPELRSWLVVKYLISEKYFKEIGDVNLELCQKAFEGLISEEEGTKKFKDELEKLLRKKEIDEEILDFSVTVLLHSLLHLFYEYVIDYLKTNPDNLVYHINTNECKIYLIENAEKGLGLTETLLNSIRGRERDFFIDFFKWSLQIINNCKIHENRVKEFVINELSEKLKYADEKTQEKFSKINNYVKNANDILKSKYKISFPIEILRNILVTKFGNDPLIMEAIVANISYCWDGCYNCVRLERGCNYDPFKQMTRVSRNLLTEFIKRMLINMEIPIQVGSGFDWILKNISQAKKILRISSPWLSKNIIQEYVEPLIIKGVQVKIITRKDLENEEQLESLQYLSYLIKNYKNIEVRYLDSLHAKMILIDDKIGIQGSMNLTLAGIYKNVELVEKYTDPRIIENLIHNFEILFSSAEDLEKEI
jgi:DEAD/DEAH box helicase domain-containing protein